MVQHVGYSTRTRLQTLWWMWMFGLSGTAAILIGVVLWSGPTDSAWDFPCFGTGLVLLVAASLAKPPPPRRVGTEQIQILRLDLQEHVYVCFGPTLEQVVKDTLEPYGSCRTLANPKRKLPLRAADRDYVDSDDYPGQEKWKIHILDLVLHAHLIVVLYGNVGAKAGRGFTWEIEMLKEKPHLLSKCIFVVPPTYSLATRRRPTTLYGKPIQARQIVATVSEGWTPGQELEFEWEEGWCAGGYRRAIERAYQRIRPHLPVTSTQSHEGIPPRH